MCPHCVPRAPLLSAAVPCPQLPGALARWLSDLGAAQGNLWSLSRAATNLGLLPAVVPRSLGF